jgi:hypothetical protein
MKMEKQGIATVLVATSAFKMLAQARAETMGALGPPMVTIPGILGGISVEEVHEKADSAFNGIVDALTRVPDAEKGTGPVTARQAETMRAPEDECARLFYDGNWTDGLPVTLPTRERVDAMLAGSSHAPEAIVGRLPPRGGVATVERVAINAVMAGCRPEYLPAILGVVEAIAHPDNNMGGWATTTGHNSPLIIMNGPVVDELGINYRTNALGTGRRANATIGRAINLIVRNIGGAIPGTTDMTTIGAAWEYTNCLAENESALPDGWQPLNVERRVTGSAVTVKCINSQIDVFSHQSGDLRQVLDTIAAGIVGINSLAILQGQGVVVALCPEVADLASKGRWSKQDVKQYVFEKSRQPLRTWKYLGDNMVASELMPECKTESDSYMMRMIPKPEDILVLVTGGPGRHSDWWPGGHGLAVTVPIDKWR